MHIEGLSRAYRGHIEGISRAYRGPGGLRTAAKLLCSRSCANGSSRAKSANTCTMRQSARRDAPSAFVRACVARRHTTCSSHAVLRVCDLYARLWAGRVHWGGLSAGRGVHWTRLSAGRVDVSRLSAGGRIGAGNLPSGHMPAGQKRTHRWRCCRRRRSTPVGAE